MSLTLCKKFSIPLHVFIVCCAFQICPDYHISEIKKLRQVFCFLKQPSFFTHLHRSPLAWSIPASTFTNLAMPAFMRVLTCNVTCFWWLLKLEDEQFGLHASCLGMGQWRHFTSTFKAMALRSSTRTTACGFGWTWPMPSVNSRTTYKCAWCLRAKGTRGHPLDVHAIHSSFYPQNLLSASTLCE